MRFFILLRLAKIHFFLIVKIEKPKDFKIVLMNDANTRINNYTNQGITYPDKVNRRLRPARVLAVG